MANKTSKLLIDVEPIIGNLGAQIKKIEGDLLDVEKKAKGIDIGGKIEGQVKDAINKIKELQQDYLKGLDKMSSGKLDVSAFEEFSKTIKGRLDAVETQITDLQSDFVNLDSEMKNFKGGDNLAKQMVTARKEFEDFKQETEEALAVLKQIQDVTNSAFKSKELQNLGKAIERIGNINFDPSKSIENTRKGVKRLTEDLFGKYKKYESLVDSMQNERRGTTVFNNMQDEIVNLLPEMELLIRQIAKLEKIDLNDIFHSTYSVGNTILGTIAYAIDADAQVLENSLINQRGKIQKEMDAVGDVMARGFTFKNGGIQIPVMLDRETINNTEDKLRELLEGLDQYSRANPVSITLKFRKFKGTEDEFKEYNKDLKNLKLAIDKTEDKGLKKQLQSIYSSVTSQYEKASKLTIKTNAPQVADDIVKSVDRIEKAIQKGKFTINPRIEITKEEKERVKKEIGKIQDPFTIDITKSLKAMGDSLKGLLDTKDTDKWVNAFAEGLKSLDTQLKPLQELIDSFNKLSKTDKKTGKTPATTKDEINLLQTFINAVESLQLALDQYHNDIKSLDAAYINVEPDFDADSFVSAIENQITRPAQIPVTPILDGVGNIVVAMQDAIDGKAITVTPVVEIDQNNVKQTNNKKTGTKKTNTQNTKQDEKEVTEVVSKYANMTRDELYEQKKVAEGKLKRVTRKDTIEKWKRTLKEINDALKATGEKKSAQEIRDDMKRLKEMMDNADKTTTEAASKAKNKSRRKKTNDGTYRPEKTPEEQLQTMKQYMKELPKVVENSKNIFGAGVLEKFRTTLDILEHYTKASDAIRQGKDDIKYLEKYGLEVHPYDPKQRTKKDIADEIKKAQENKKLEQPSKDIIRLSELYAQTGELKHLKEISKLTNDNEFDAYTKKVIHDAINVELARVSKEIKAETDKADGFEALKKDIEKNKYSIEDKAKKFLEYQKKSGNTTHQVGELSTDMTEGLQLTMAYNKLSEAAEKNTEKTKENKKAHEDNNKTKSQSKKDAKATTEADTQATSENTQEVNKNTNAIKANKQWQEKRKKIYDEVKNQFKNQNVNINKLSKEDKEKLLDDVTTLSREKRWTAKTSADEFYKRAKALKEEQDAAKKARLEEQKLAEAKDKQRVHNDLARMRGETHIKKEEKSSLISLQKSLEENIAYLKSEYGWNGKDSSLDKLSTVGNGVKASIKEYQQSRDRLNNAIAEASQEDKDALQKYIDEKNKAAEKVAAEQNKKASDLQLYKDALSSRNIEFSKSKNDPDKLIDLYADVHKLNEEIDNKMLDGTKGLEDVGGKTALLLGNIKSALKTAGYELDKANGGFKKIGAIVNTSRTPDDWFDLWKTNLKERGGFNLNKKADKIELNKYIEQYKWYQKSGGTRSITELSDDVKTQQKLANAYQNTTSEVKENTKAKKENSATTSTNKSNVQAVEKETSAVKENTKAHKENKSSKEKNKDSTTALKQEEQQSNKTAKAKSEESNTRKNNAEAAIKESISIDEVLKRGREQQLQNAKDFKKSNPKYNKLSDDFIAYSEKEDGSYNKDRLDYMIQKRADAVKIKNQLIKLSEKNAEDITNEDINKIDEFRQAFDKLENSLSNIDHDNIIDFKKIKQEFNDAENVVFDKLESTDASTADLKQEEEQVKKTTKAVNELNEAKSKGKKQNEKKLPSTDVHKQNESLGEQKKLYEQILNRVQAIRGLGVFGRKVSDTQAFYNGDYGFESLDSNAYQKQLDGLKTLTPHGKTTTSIRDLVFDPSKTAEEVAKKLVRAAENYQICKNDLDEMFAEKGIIGGNIYDQAYETLDIFGANIGEMHAHVESVREQLSVLKTEEQQAQATAKAQKELGEAREQSSKRKKQSDAKSELSEKERQIEALRKEQSSILETVDVKNRDKVSTLELIDAYEKLNKLYSAISKLGGYQEDSWIVADKQLNELQEYLLMHRNAQSYAKSKNGKEYWFDESDVMNALFTGESGVKAKKISPKPAGEWYGDEYIQGILSKVPEAGEAAEQLPKTAEKSTAKAQDSQSPSKVAMKLGEYWGEGYAEGILSTQARVRNAVEALVATGELTTKDLVNDTRRKKSDTKEASKAALERIKAGKELTAQGQEYKQHVQNVKDTDYYNSLTTLMKERGDDLNAKLTKVEKAAIQDAIKITKANNQFGGTGEYNPSLDILSEELAKAFIEANQPTREELERQRIAYLKKRAQAILGEELIDLNETTRLKENKNGDSKPVTSLQGKGKNGRVTIDPWGMQIGRKRTHSDDYTKYQEKVKTLTKEMDGYLSSILDKEIKIGQLRTDGNDVLADQLTTEVERDRQKYEENRKYLEELGEEEVLQKQLIKEVTAYAQQEDKINEIIAARIDKENKAKENNTAKVMAENETARQKEIDELKKKYDKIYAENAKAEEAEKKRIASVQAENEKAQKAETDALVKKYDKMGKEAEKAKIAEEKRVASVQAENEKANNAEINALTKKYDNLEKEKEKAEKEEEKRLANEAKAQEKYEQQQIKDAQKRTDKDFAEMQKREYDELGAKVKEYIALRKTIAKGEGLEEDIEKAQKLFDEIVNLNVELKSTKQLLFNSDLETKAMKGMDTIDEEVRRIEEGVARKEQEVRSKAYERLSGKLQSAQYDIGFELENGAHTAKFNEELKEIQSELIAINNIKIDVVTQQDITDAQKLLERVREIRKEGKLTSNKQANENSLQKNLAQVNSMLSGNTKLAFKRTDVYKELMRLQTLFKSFDTSRPQAELAELTTRLLQTKAKFDALANSVKGQNLFQTFLERIHGTTAQLVAQYLSWMDIIRYARTAISSIVELDTALVDLRKTTKMSATELDQFYFTSNEIAKQLGVTTSEVISQAAAWSRFNKIDPLYGNI